MSVLETMLTADAARNLTEEVKADAHALWAKLLRLYEGGAHTALGYSSWGDYCAAEFDMGRSRSYQVLDAARVVEALPESTMVDSGPSERQARELTPLCDEPDRMAAAWSEAVERQPDMPTAADVREVVQEVRSGSVHFSSETDEWATPQDLFDRLDGEFNFDVDVCALPHNAKVARYFTPEQDGLAQDWVGTCWMNPPYGAAIRDWVAKASEAAGQGATVVALLPARVETNWWWDYCRHAEVRFMRGRLKFGGSPNSAPFPSVVVIFGRAASVVWWSPSEEETLRVAA